MVYTQKAHDRKLLHILEMCLEPMVEEFQYLGYWRMVYTENTDSDWTWLPGLPQQLEEGGGGAL